jgi:adenylosuccinate synthase
LTKIDVLDGLETVKVVNAYRKNGSILTATEVSNEQLSLCEPVYEEFDGWEGPVSGLRLEKDLPNQLVRFVDFIEQEINVPIRMLSLGPDHDETVWRTPKIQE